MTCCIRVLGRRRDEHQCAYGAEERCRIIEAISERMPRITYMLRKVRGFCKGTVKMGDLNEQIQIQKQYSLTDHRTCT